MEEKQTISNQLRKNGYPKLFIDSCERTKPTPVNQGRPRLSSISIPYVRNSSEAIRRILNSVDIRVSFSATNTIATKFRNGKDPIPIEQKGDVIYKISCMDCDKCYIGQTSRGVGVRMENPCVLSKRAPISAEERRRGEVSSGIAAHVWNTKHTVDFNSPIILSDGWVNYY